ncbi:hypothetical protein H9I48_00820 [Wolbachia pipientis]|uniref:hypothetical protein n=1 Tax=Wolbachia pipientis TaxID=955 RepID=UPI001651449A|nr:hypothetical protein [Wolbachia pipientis]MBC6685808.1 hypothetical protein [Wolbachia pipientis]
MLATFMTSFFFLDPSSLGTGMTSFTMCHITMFVQLCVNYFCGTVCYSIFMLVLLKIIVF